MIPKVVAVEEAAGAVVVLEAAALAQRQQVRQEQVTGFQAVKAAGPEDIYAMALSGTVRSKGIVLPVLRKQTAPCDQDPPQIQIASGSR